MTRLWMRCWEPLRRPLRNPFFMNAPSVLAEPQSRRAFMKREAQVRKRDLKFEVLRWDPVIFFSAGMSCVRLNFRTI